MAQKPETQTRRRTRSDDDKRLVSTDVNKLFFQIIHRRKTRTYDARLQVPTPLFNMFRDRNMPSIIAWLRKTTGESDIKIKNIDDLTEEHKTMLFGITDQYSIPLIINHEYAVVDSTKTNYGESGVYFRTYTAPFKNWWEDLTELQTWPSIGVYTISTNDEDKTIIQKWDMPDVVHPNQVHPKRGHVICISRPLNTHRYYDLFIKQIIDRMHRERQLEPVETFVV